MLSPLLLIGRGTQGSCTVQRVIDLLLQWTSVLPTSVAYQLIDGAASRPGMDQKHHVQVSLNGCGADPKVGQTAFRRLYAIILTAIEQQVLQLRSCHHVPCKLGPKELLTIWIVSGNGGSSGGMLQEVIDLCHDIARRLGIKKIRVNLLFLGPEMPLRDTTRSVTSEQELVVRQTAVSNFTRILRDHQSDALLTITPPYDAPFSIPACQRIWRMMIIDQSNGVYDLPTVADFTEMCALNLLGSIFTYSGIVTEDRYADHDGQGGTGRGRLS
ncbi:MAG: hypothetical protein R3C18_06975 [Planctomycetaceae bacterium]